jgi:hypothetical protein
MPMNVPITATGMVTAGTAVARAEAKKAKITSTTSTTAMPSARTTSRIDSLMNTASSEPISTSMPSGRNGRSRSSCSRTRFESAMVLACDWRITPSPTDSRPSERTTVWSSSTPRCTCAMSASRTG